MGFIGNEHVYSVATYVQNITIIIMLVATCISRFSIPKSGFLLVGGHQYVL